MAYQQGVQTLTSGTTSYSFTGVFSPAFASPPTVVLTKIQNTTADDPKLLIEANVTAITVSGFDVELDSAPNTNNYELVWLAGDEDLVVTAVSAVGIKTTSLGLPTRELLPGDLFPAVVSDPSIRTVRVPFSKFLNQFIAKVSTPPSAPTDSGTIGDVAYDNNYIYWHSGTRWNRSYRSGNASDWTLDNPHYLTQNGDEVLGSAVTTASVTYPTAFPAGNTPAVWVQVENTTDSTPLGINAVVTARSLTGFSVRLSAATDSVNYKLVWKAEQTPL